MITIHKFFQRIIALTTVAVTAMLSPSTYAYYEFTYTSQQLPFTYGLIDGSLDSDLGGGDYTEWFSISFKSDTELSSTVPTMFTMNNPIVTSSADRDSSMNIAPSSTGHVMLNPDGTIASWSLDLALFTQPINRYEEVLNTHVNLYSSGGTSSCNCDELVYRYTVAIERAYDQWASGATLEFHSQGANATSNWTITKTSSVPEPSSIILLVAGFSLIGLTRRRKHIL